MSKPLTVVVEAKSWQSSHTIWLSVLSVVIPLALYITENALALGIPDRAIPWIALFVFAAGNIRQRFSTTQPIGKAGELVPVDGAGVAPTDNLDDRKFEAIAAALGSQHNELIELRADIQGILERQTDVRDIRRAAREPEEPERIFTEQATGPRPPGGLG